MRHLPFDAFIITPPPSSMKSRFLLLFLISLAASTNVLIAGLIIHPGETFVGDLQMEGDYLVNNGTVTGHTNISAGGVATGGGNFGSVEISLGGMFSPGNSPGTATLNGSMTWGAGGLYDFEINNATGTAGGTSGWDLTNLNGAGGFLNITAGTTPGSRFQINIISGDADSSFAAANFNSSLSYQWLFMHTTAGITGFDPAKLTLNASDFVNPTGGGSFSLSQSGNDLYLNFSSNAVPEPTGLLTGLLCLGLAGMRRRRR